MFKSRVKHTWSVQSMIGNAFEDGEFFFNTRCFGSSMIWFAEEMFEASRAKSKREAFLELTDALGVLVACNLKLRGLIDNCYVSGSLPQGTTEERAAWMSHNFEDTIQRKFSFDEWKRSFTSAIVWPALTNAPTSSTDMLLQLEALMMLTSAGAETLFHKHLTRTNLYKEHLRVKGRQGDAVSDEVLALLRHAPNIRTCGFSMFMLDRNRIQTARTLDLTDLWCVLGDFGPHSSHCYRNFVIGTETRDNVLDKMVEPIYVTSIRMDVERLSTYAVLHIDDLVGRSLPEAYLDYLVWFRSPYYDVFDTSTRVSSPTENTRKPVSFLYFSEFFTG